MSHDYKQVTKDITSALAAIRKEIPDVLSLSCRALSWSIAVSCHSFSGCLNPHLP